LTVTDADVERVKAYDKAFTDIFKRGGTSSTPIVQQLAVELSPISLRVMEAQIKELTGKLKGKDVIDLLPPIEETKKKLDDESEAYEKAIKRRQTLNASELSNELLLSAKRFNDGIISQEEYEKAKLDIHKKYSVNGLDFLIEELQHEKDFAFKGLEVTQDVADRQAALDERINKAKLDREELLAAKKEELAAKTSEKLKAIAEASFDLGTSLLDARYERELNHIQDLIDANDKYYAKQIENITNSNLTDQQKAEQTAVLKAEQTAKDDQLQKRMRDEKLKQAKFDRDAQALKIFGEAVYAHFAIIAAFATELNPLAGLGYALANDALAAIQIAALFAKPLPKYALGTKDHPGGAAIIGEGKHDELVEMPDGRMFVASSPMLLNLPQHTQVTPLSDDSILEQAMSKLTSKTISATTNRNVNHSEQLLRDLLNETKKANKKQNKFHFNFKHDPTWQRYKDGYFDRNQ